MKTHRLYACGICDCLHPWDWNGDCRENGCRYGDAGEYATAHNVSVYDVEVLTMDERVEADSDVHASLIAQDGWEDDSEQARRTR